MKHRTSELSGALLDAAVERARIKSGHEVTTQGFPWPYSSDWRYGGPIIEREKVALVYDRTEWEAYVGGYQTYDGLEAKPTNGYCMGAETPLIAACRAFVRARLGDDVELP